MQLNSLFIQLLAVTTVVSARPFEAEEHSSVRRAPATEVPNVIDGFPAKDWVCDTNTAKGTTVTFGGQYIEDSTREGLKRRNADNLAGKYPEYLTDPTSIPGMPNTYKDATNVDHFPLNYDGKTVFSGGNPTSGARVVYQFTKGEDKATFIGLWTHAEKKDGSFIACREQ